MAINILVSGAAGDVAQGVLKSLQQSTLSLDLYTTCISPYSSWLHKDIKSYIAPLSSSEEYIPFMIRLLRIHKIDVFFPTVDSEITKISAAKQQIERESNAVVFVDDIEKLGIAVDKLNTVKFLKEFGFPYPESVSAADSDLINLEKNFGYPLIVKKRTSGGSRDVYKINNHSELSPYLGNDEYLVQEWLDPSEGEFTSGIYIGDDGDVKGICILKRKLKNGSTYIAERIINQEFEIQLESIARKLGLKYLNIQSMKKNDVLVPFEFNGRLSGSTAMVSHVFNAPEMFIRERLLGAHLQRLTNENQFIAMRYLEEVYTTPQAIDNLVARSKTI